MKSQWKLQSGGTSKPCVKWKESDTKGRMYMIPFVWYPHDGQMQETTVDSWLPGEGGRSGEQYLTGSLVFCVFVFWDEGQVLELEGGGHCAMLWTDWITHLKMWIVCPVGDRTDCQIPFCSLKMFEPWGQEGIRSLDRHVPFLLKPEANG